MAEKVSSFKQVVFQLKWKCPRAWGPGFGGVKLVSEVARARVNVSKTKHENEPK